MDQDFNDRRLQELAAQTGERLRAAGWCLTTAESCTGGWIAKCLTDVAGSSEWFQASAVTYSDAMKSRHLGVSAETLGRDGAVSEATVVEMARGVLDFADADLAVAVSGIAGPDGGTLEKPVGLVWMAWANRQEVQARRFRFAGDREAVRRQAVAQALDGILSFCEGRAGH